MVDFVDVLKTIVSGLSSQAQAAPVPGMPAVAPKGDRVGTGPFTGGIQLPMQAPIPGQRPATLPGGTFSPNAAPPPPIPVPPQPQQQGGNPLAQLLGGGAGGKDMIRAMLAGMSNLRPTGGDPFLMAGLGAGGAGRYYDDKDAAASAAAVNADKIAYERAQDAQKFGYTQQKDAADLELRRLSEDRQAKTAELANKKTAAEIERLARQNGLTTSQMLEIERIAQAEAEGVTRPEKRREIIERKRRELLEQFGQGGLSGNTLSGSDSDYEQIAEDADGNRVGLRAGQWVPING